MSLMLIDALCHAVLALKKISASCLEYRGQTALAMSFAESLASFGAVSVILLFAQSLPDRVRAGAGPGHWHCSVTTERVGWAADARVETVENTFSRV